MFMILRTSIGKRRAINKYSISRQNRKGGDVEKVEASDAERSGDGEQY